MPSRHWSNLQRKKKEFCQKRRNRQKKTNKNVHPKGHQKKKSQRETKKRDDDDKNKKRKKKRKKREEEERRVAGDTRPRRRRSPAILGQVAGHFGPSRQQNSTTTFRLPISIFILIFFFDFFSFRLTEFYRVLPKCCQSSCRVAPTFQRVFT